MKRAAHPVGTGHVGGGVDIIVITNFKQLATNWLLRKIISHLQFPDRVPPEPGEDVLLDFGEDAHGLNIRRVNLALAGRVDLGALLGRQGHVGPVLVQQAPGRDGAELPITTLL